MKEIVYLLLGSNEGAREYFIRSAIADIVREAAAGAVLQSSLYETAAWGIEDQPSFLNTAISFQTSHSATGLLGAIQNIEAKYGRQRDLVWGQRTLDIDILLFGTSIIERPQLTVPHAHLPVRRFALAPLAEIAGEVMHPVLHKSIAQLLEECPDTLPVSIYKPAQQPFAVRP